MTLQEALMGSEFKVRAYSGRGMSGAECVGVAVTDISEAVAITDYLHSKGVSSAGVRTDTLGKGIIAYWPNHPWRETEGVVDYSED